MGAEGVFETEGEARVKATVRSQGSRGPIVISPFFIVSISREAEPGRRKEEPWPAGPSSFDMERFVFVCI